ncbi:MAG: RrF2 family transcriptional regulator [Acidimicrobiales bacterium]
MRLEVTRKSDLAVRALRVLDVADGRVKGSTLADAVGSTPGFLSQVVNPLVRAGWIRSDPGPTGGYSLAVDLADVSVLAVIEAIEGPTDDGNCVLIDRPCGDSGPCAIHEPWSRALECLVAELAGTSVADAELIREVAVALADERAGAEPQLESSVADGPAG